MGNYVMEKLPLSARIMGLMKEMGPVDFHKIGSFDEITDKLALDDDDHQAILDAYGKYGNDLDVVADAVKDPANKRPKNDVARDICNQMWQHVGAEVGNVGFLRMHAALLVGGHTERFVRCAPKAAIRAENFVTPQAVVAARARKAAKNP